MINHEIRDLGMEMINHEINVLQIHLNTPV
jgi:hypothetical protein